MTALQSEAPPAHATVLHADAVAALPSVPLGPVEGAHQKVLWSTGSSVAGVLTVEAGRRLGPHAHSSNDHHIWVLGGRAVILGKEVAAGSYAHIPCGIEHDIDATDTEGCTVFYLYAPAAAMPA